MERVRQRVAGRSSGYRRHPFEAEGQAYTIGSFLETSYANGFLVLHGGKIVAERYLNGMTPYAQRPVVIGRQVGRRHPLRASLIGRGMVDPTASLTHYLPELEATAYNGATVQHVLDMTSGVAFDETYTALDSHMAQLDVASGWKKLQLELAYECLGPDAVFEGSGVPARYLLPLSIDRDGCTVLRSTACRRYPACRTRQP
ncbi:hypothetical protein ACOJBM_41195 [Rhizobium beringeri]